MLKPKPIPILIVLAAVAATSVPGISFASKPAPATCPLSEYQVVSVTPYRTLRFLRAGWQPQLEISTRKDSLAAMGGKTTKRTAPQKKKTSKGVSPLRTKPAVNDATKSKAVSRRARFKTDEASQDQPVLLSGGNPQIAKADGEAPVRAYIAAMPGWKSDVGRQLDALVVRIVPGVRKAVRWNSPFYGVEGQGWFLSFHCFTKYVKLTFLRGKALRPPPPVESKDPNTRYFHIHEHDPVDGELLSRWIRQAAELPGDPLF